MDERTQPPSNGQDGGKRITNRALADLVVTLTQNTNDGFRLVHERLDKLEKAVSNEEE